MPENLRHAKHKDWATNFVYQETMLAQLDPVVQALQAPLHLMTKPGRTVCVAALSAQIDQMQAELLAQFHASILEQLGPSCAENARSVQESLTIIRHIIGKGCLHFAPSTVLISALCELIICLMC